MIRWLFLRAAPQLEAMFELVATILTTLASISISPAFTPGATRVRRNDNFAISQPFIHRPQPMVVARRGDRVDLRWHVRILTKLPADSAVW